MSAVAIRFGRPADLPRLDPIDASAAESFARAGQPLPDGSPPAPPGHWAGVLAAGLLWIADDADAGPIGFVAGERADHGLYIGQISVALEHQRRGLGRRLMRTAIDWARGEGLAEVTLETFRTIPWNGPFYASLGFRELGEAELTEHLAHAIALQVSHGFTDRCAMRLEL
jgi:GNAT superfamily N-acetyltransferase